MYRVNRSIPVFAAILIMIIGVGCGKSDNPVVARVGSHDITAEEFEDILVTLPAQPYASADDEFAKRREILDSVIVNRLLIDAAYEKNIDKLEELNRVIVANKDKFLLDILYKSEISDKSAVTDAEVREFYDHSEFKIRASHILVDSMNLAQVVMERIENGENFEKLAYELSIDPSARRNKGDLGFFLWGAMVQEFQEVAFALEPGEISPPIKSDFGYHIIKLVERQPNERRGDFSTQLEKIRTQIIGIKRNQLADTYFKTIKEKYIITVDSTTCNYLMKKREQLYPPEILANLPSGDFDIEQLDRNERQLVLASWGGGQITVEDYLNLAKDVPQGYKPSFDITDSVGMLVFELKKLDILTYEALRQGLDKNPEFIRKMTLFKELSMADIMRNDSMPQPLPADEGMIRQYYDENLDEFKDQAQVHVYEILLSDEIEARRLADKVDNLEYFKELAMDMTERPGKRAVAGDLGYVERRWFPEIFDLAIKSKRGTVAGPVVTQGKYSIFYIADKLDEQIKDFLTVKSQVKSKVDKNQKVQAFSSWVSEQKSATSIEVFEDALWTTIKMENYSDTPISTN